ncbi:C40 family peptidase [Effusibacillus dendaii]|uniref:NlpC/P60 domain-containing protein n=1 Tax=Effusibacillus dendaii TaxID=2743772 RepID=A0A7I8DE26_9BACL|nr:C40 family peptidase [Effusibacillus dendaii]BCJ88364.1 hypothetical protein skT53_33490 [Effusibacillus dendaii]
MFKKKVVSLLTIGMLSAAFVSPSFVSAQTTATQSASFNLPPGVTYDPSIQPIAPLDATREDKTNAVLMVAKSQLGTPYIWGTSKDRGGSGFDCSNYTAYVYRHALGYKMSGASRVQASSVGNPVPKSQMEVGDLVIFDNGAHIGIYAGNGQMIQEGGGLKKVGYLPLKPGSYWYNHITSVKRMY